MISFVEYNEIIFYLFYYIFGDRIMRLEYYINIMMERLDFGSLNTLFLDVEEISSSQDID